MKRIITILAVALCAGAFALQPANAASPEPQVKAAKASKKTETVVFTASMHCKNCVKKINENMAFEKGVKDLAVSLEEKTVTITYDPSKTSAEALGKALGKLGFQVEKK